MPKKVRHASMEGFFSCPEHPMFIVPTMDNSSIGLHGGSFFGKLGKSLKKEFKHVGHILAPVAKSALNEAKSGAISIGNKLLSEGKEALKNEALKQIGATMGSEGAMSAAGKPKRKRAVSAKMAKRHALVKKLMKEKGMTLPEASKYIKQNNLV